MIENSTIGGPDERSDIRKILDGANEHLENMQNEIGEQAEKLARLRPVKLTNDENSPTIRLDRLRKSYFRQIEQCDNTAENLEAVRVGNTERVQALHDVKKSRILAAVAELETQRSALDDRITARRELITKFALEAEEQLRKIEDEFDRESTANQKIRNQAVSALAASGDYKASPGEAS